MNYKDGLDPKMLERFFKKSDEPSQLVLQEVAEDEEYLPSRVSPQRLVSNDDPADHPEPSYLEKIEGQQHEKMSSVLYEDEQPAQEDHQEEVPISPIVPLPTDHCLGVSEDDPNFLLKMLTLKPEKGYVPTFLRGDLTEDDSDSGWLGTYESEKDSASL
jgi:hypothetical protein